LYYFLWTVCGGRKRNEKLWFYHKMDHKLIDILNGKFGGHKMLYWLHDLDDKQSVKGLGLLG